MARPISYTPPPVDHEGQAAQAQVDDFVAALHESGLLRAATGMVRSYPDVAALLVQRLDPQTLRSLAALGGLVQSMDPEATERFVGAIRSSVEAADEAGTAREAPSVVGLARQLGDPDVRRGAGAVLSALGAFGRTMHDPPG